ncbi:MAG: methyltransferase domain-containing protein [Bacillota bacterium]
MDFEYLLKEYIERGDAYCPIVLNNILYYQYSRRNYKNFLSRINLFPNLKNESVVDVGCNNGFNLIHLKKYHNAGMSLGLDIDFRSLNVAKYIKNQEKIHNLEFSAFDLNDELFLEELPAFDNYLFLSVVSLFTVHYNLDFDTVVRRLFEKTKKNLYVEPINHEMFKKRKYKRLYMEYFSKLGSVEFLGYTSFADPERRGIFKISK